MAPTPFDRNLIAAELALMAKNPLRLAADERRAVLLAAAAILRENLEIRGIPSA